MKKSLGLSVLAGLALLGVTINSAADNQLYGASTRILAFTCDGCHGPNGSSLGPATPSIAGMDTDYFVEMMRGFRDDEIYSTVMGRIARGYSDDEIQRMADYFHDEPFVPAKQAFDAQLVDQGRKLHEKYCDRCHEDGGIPLEDEEYFILAGQWTPYLSNAMADFRAERRPVERRMRKKLDKLLALEGEAGLEALFAFFASQQ